MMAGHTETDRLPAASPAPLAERLAAWLVPKTFLISVVAGFAAAAALGGLSTHGKMFSEFRRFHQFIGSDSFFNPTALQVRRLLDGIPADRIVVIVGGSSRFNGVGQTPAGLWSGALQERLGPRYHVINLALRAGGISQFGAHAAEMLLRAAKPVILLGDIHVTETFQPLGESPLYRYFYHDAAARGLLLDWPPRTAAIAELRRSGPEQSAIDEGRLRASLNAAFNFDELWTYIAYHHGFWGGWHPVLAYRQPFAPRSTFPDPEQSVPLGGYYSHYTIENAMVYLRQFARPLPDSHWSALGASLDPMPDLLRAHLIAVAIRQSPYYTDRFLAAERAGYEANYRRFVDTLRDAGVRSIDVGEGWVSTDYADMVHVSELGGRKFAETVAPLVRQLASDLGYDR
jgi:hypothetical protein